MSDPSHYNNTMTEIINLCCSAETSFDALLKDRNDIACELSFARERIAALEARIEGMIEPYSDKDKRIRDLEAEVRALRSAGYSCPTCDNDAMDSVAETDCDHDLQHATHTMVVASYPDYQTATCRVCGAQFSTDVGDSTENRGGEHG